MHHAPPAPDTKPHYPKRNSRVDIIFMDGEVKSYTITAGASLARYLAEDAGRTGILNLLCGSTAHAIPVTNIREWTLTELEDNADASMD